MNYYFHDDVDGLTCSALFHGFIKTKGYKIGLIKPMSYGGSFYSRWQEIALKSPSVVLDFRYHPTADWFFDHHTSTFMRKDWQENFVSDERHFFDEKYPSCFGYVYDMLVKHYGFKPSERMKKLRPLVDMLDSANYPSAKYYVMLEGNIAKLDILLEKLRKNNKIPHLFFIKALSNGDLNSILKIKKYARIINNVKKEVKFSLANLANIIDVKSGISLTDATKFKTYLPRYSDYYLNSDLEYSITVKKSKDVYSVSVGKNPWSKLPSVLHLGRLQQTFGGGGHENAAGSECATYEEAIDRANKIRVSIIEALNKL